MGMLHPTPGPHPVHRLHRVSAAAIGTFLVLFALLGMTRRLALLATNGSWVLGLSSNGLLSIISLVVGAVLVGSAVRSGQTASTTAIVVGVAFLLSGMANMMVLGTSMNILAFRLSNIIFSVLVGLLLLVMGSYGRISGGLPPGNPYRNTSRDVPAAADHGADEPCRDFAVTQELAEAERAFALHYATEDQLRRLLLVHAYRSAEDRCRAWQSSAVPVLAAADVRPAHPVLAADAGPAVIGVATGTAVRLPRPRRPRSVARQ
jgi:Domain of unknown function (DUF4383)